MRFNDKKWAEMMRVRLDTNNMFDTNTGMEHGISKALIDKMQDKLTLAHNQVAEARRSEQFGFMSLPYNQAENIQAINQYVLEQTGKFDNIVVLGIGGSALGMIALQRALNPYLYNEYAEIRNGKPRLYVLDNIDPVWFNEFLTHLDIKRTLFNVISKSGGTAETMAQFLIIKERLEKVLGDGAIGNLVFTTSAQQGNLIKIAKNENINTFFIPENVGGRFSVLSSVGLLPAAFVGIDIEELLSGAAYMDKICQNGDVWQNPAYLYATLLYLANQAGTNVGVMIPYSSQLKDIADWYAQLLGESLGKRLDRKGNVVNAGITPVKALGATDQHSQLQLYIEGPYDKVITFIEVKKFINSVVIPEKYEDVGGLEYLGGHSLDELINVEKQATELALTKSGRLNCTIYIPEVNAFTIGQLIYMLELQIAFSGELLDIDAFDQPGVELGKEYTYGILGHKKYQHMKVKFEDGHNKDCNLIV